VGLSLILVLVFAAQWLTLRHAIRKVAQSQVLMHLEHDGSGLLSSLELRDDNALGLREIGVEEVYHQPMSGHYFVVFSDGKRALASASLGNEALPAMAVPSGTTTVREVDGPNGQRVLTLSQGRRLQGHEISITVGEELATMNQEINRRSMAALGWILPLLIATVLVQNMTIRRELRPLAGVQNELQKLRHGELGRIEGDVPGEIRPLVDEVNRLLELMHRRLQQSRTAVGNLAHSIKTPWLCCSGLQTIRRCPRGSATHSSRKPSPSAIGRNENSSGRGWQAVAAWGHM
jgi:methyl-accepting chemotaxis protein